MLASRRACVRKESAAENAAAAAECFAQDRQSGASPGAESAGGRAAVRQREECACALCPAQSVSRSAVAKTKIEVPMKGRNAPGSIPDPSGRGSGLRARDWLSVAARA